MQFPKKRTHRDAFVGGRVSEDQESTGLHEAGPLKNPLALHIRGADQTSLSRMVRARPSSQGRHHQDMTTIIDQNEDEFFSAFDDSQRPSIAPVDKRILKEACERITSQV